MASLKLFGVTFDRPNATYMPGETVSGKIILDTIKEKQVRGLYVSTKGISYVHWTESDSLNDSKTRTYSNSEKYYHFKYYIFGTQDFDSRHNLPHGHNQYPFSFRLPNNIPCSFEHTNGYIRYTVKAVIDRPWKFDHECKAAFTVVSNLDLNLHREKCFGINDGIRKSFKRLCWCGQGSMDLQITVPSSGYVPGQTISTTLNYMNYSNELITKVSATLLRKLQFHATSKTLSSIQAIKKASHFGSFPRNEQITSEILVPPIAPSYLQYCKIIDLDYELVVSIHVSRPCSKIKRTYPLLIGTIPLYYPSLPPPYNVVPYSSNSDVTKPAIMPAPMPEQASAANISTAPTQYLANSSSFNQDIPPPSYEESMSGTRNIRDHNESDFVFGANTFFAPKYPVFNYPARSISK
ncbi:arrestin domain-containing protein 17-like [Bombus pyrosoma]|uniref:arrestin domain-containing protein 17-like n=1 Tax=Bombus pyrosoma TaxID=396416 RepID=UPI001CB89768|nr:arrestin domain-containing protein 17-like [Bombus pyrosoma]XP_043580848.1 arrestin domain-containing protein 17-like [Bombus pyrosoma]